jgi:hypothetical protein
VCVGSKGKQLEIVLLSLAKEEEVMARSRWESMLNAPEIRTWEGFN